jgi:hypothetical protein
MLISSLEKEHQPPCQDSIEGSIKESGLLNGFASEGRLRWNAATKDGAASTPKA